MANLTIGYPNRLDSSAVLGGGWSVSLPISNIKDRRLSKIARSDNATAYGQSIEIDFGVARTVGLFMIAAHNLSASGQVEIRGGTTTGVTEYGPILVNAYAGGVIPPESKELGSNGFWMATMTQNAIAGYRCPFIFSIPAKPSYRYWSIRFNDPTNADGYIQLGRIFIGDAYTFDYNVDFGSGLSFEDSTIIQESIGGEEYFDTRKNKRVHNLTLNNLSSVEAYNRVIDMQRYAGVVGEVAVIPDTADTTNGFRRNFIGRLAEVGGFTDQNFDRRSANLVIKETF